MKRVKWVVLVAIAFAAIPAWAASYTSSQSGDWSLSSTWGGAGVPGSGDTVTITSNHFVTVSTSESAQSVTLDAVTGNKVLSVTGTLNIVGVSPGALSIVAPSPGSSNIVRIDGGTLSTGGGVSISGGTTASKIEFTSLGGSVSIGSDLLFSGTAANAIVDFGASGAGTTLSIGGDLGNGGTILTNTSSVVAFVGAGAQTVNSYTFHHFTVNKPSGTATLNGPISVNGDLTITSGVLDDGGNQISLNAGTTSNLVMGSAGVLKLGSSVTATTFPSPLASSSLTTNSAIVYQGGATQTIANTVTYRRLFITTMGSAVTHVLGGAVSVLDELNVVNNAANVVTLSVGSSSLDVDGNITGDGQITAGTGQIHVGGNWNSSVSFACGSGLVVFDGTGNQNVPGTNYHQLAITKGSGTATLAGVTAVADTLAVSGGTLQTSGNALTVTGAMTVAGTLDATSTTVTALDNVTVTGSVVGAGATFKFNGSAAQSITTSSNITTGTIEQNNLNTVTLNGIGVWSVTAALNLYGGILHVNGGTGTLFVDVLASVNRTTGWVRGPLTMGMNATPARRFEIGSATAYLPVDVDAASAGTVAMAAVDGQYPNRTASNVLERYWTIDGSSSVTSLDSITFNYNASDVVNGTESSYVLAQYSASTFTRYGNVNAVSHTATQTSVSNYKTDWTVGEPASLGASSILTVTNVNDSGAGSLRDAIVTANSGACISPCTIQFSVSGTINLATSLPAIVASGLTIDGFTAPGASPNTNAFGQPSNAVLTIAIDGTVGIPVGFDIQQTNVKIAGFGIQNFAFGGSGFGVRFAGTNTGSSVIGCYIGTDLSGSTSAPNAYGVVFNNSTGGATLGGSTPDTRNLVSGNTTYGVIVTGTSNTVSVKGNYVGTNRSLSGALPNTTGIYVGSSTSGVTIGGSGTGNVVSGNSGSGIKLAGGGATVAGNIVGPAGSSTTALPNAIGIEIFAGSANTIGGASPSDQNTISGNTSHGILIDGYSTVVESNVIGIAPDGTTPMGNGGSGVYIQSSSSNNQIGTTNGNKIANNTADGVTLVGSGISNEVRRGSVSGNGNLAIDLGDDGVTPNDATDSDTGPNNKQNFPTITQAIASGGNLTVAVSMNSSAAVNASGYVFDLYKADGSANPQAATYLGSSACLAGNTFSNAGFSVSVGSIVAGDKIVATATAYSDITCTSISEGTSELSASALVGGDIHWIAGSGNWETAANWSPATVPSVNDNVFIDNAGTYTVTINSLASVKNLTVGTGISGTQTLVVSSGNSLTMTDPTSVTTTGVLILSGNSLAGTGGLDVYGTLEWNSGSITGVAGVTVHAGATLNIATAAAKVLNQRLITINTGGTANWLGGNLTLSNAGGISNSGLFEVKTDATISDGGSDAGFQNNGTLRKSTTSGSTSFTSVDLMHNAGTIDIQTGTLNPGSGNAVAPITISSGAIFAIDSDVYSLNNGANVTGLGKVHVSAGTLSINGNITLEHLQLDGTGIVDGTGLVTLGSTGSWLWSGGTHGGSGTTQIPSGASLTVSGVGAKSLQNRTISIQAGGTMAFTGTGTFNMSTGGTISNTGTLDFQADLTVSDAGSDGGISNSGLMKKSAGAGATILSNVSLTNVGTLQVQTGTFNPAIMTSSGAVVLTGNLVVDSDTVTLNGSSDVSGTGLLQVTAGTLTVDSNDVIPNFELSGGTVNGTAILTLTSASWSAGTMAGSGTTAIPAASALTISGASGKSLQRTLSVASGGAVTVTGSGTINMLSGGNINNAGTLTLSVDLTFNNAGGAGGIVNSGTFAKTTTTGTTTLSAIALTNNGGLLDLQSGILSVTGAFSQPSGTLRVRLGGVIAGTQHSQLALSGTPSFAGTLDVTLNGPYQPNGGDTFRVITATGHSGDFSPYTYPPLSGGHTFSSAYDASGLLLSVSSIADLGITKTASATVTVSAPIAYSIIVTNNGPDTATGVSVSDTLPAGHTSIAASGTGWTCNVVSLTVTCTVASLNAGTAPAITINANAPSTPSTFTNTASVTSSSTDANGTNDSGSATVTTNASQADIETLASSPGSPIAQSTAFTFTFTVKNNGPQTATGVTFTAPIPATLSYTSAAPDAGTCNFSANVVTCSLGSIASANQLQIVLSLSSTTSTGTHSVTGSASATEGDPSGTNNAAAATVSVTGSTMVVTNTNDSGTGSLRQAITDANAGLCTPLPCTITFNIASGPFVITPATILPLIGNQVFVDATTQPGYAGTPIVQLSGKGLNLNGSGGGVKGFSITGAGYGVDINGNNNIVEANYLGLDPTGAAAGNFGGVRVFGNSNTIGGPSAAQRNIISGNTNGGVILTSPASSNIVAGNYIGTDPTGLSARPNDTGVAIYDDSNSNVIGGTSSAYRNIISGNTTYGVYLLGSTGSTADTNSILFNWIGPAANGTTSFASTIGIRVGTDAPGTIIGQASKGNVIAGHGIGIQDDSGTSAISGNTIGVAPDGVTAMANTTGGILINAAATNIGGTAAGEANTIAYSGYGVGVTSGVATSILGNSIHDNPGTGIDLNIDGATANDATDSDAGPNGLQNWPTLTSVSLVGGGNVHIAYTIDSSGAAPAIGSVLVEFFKADVTGEGKFFLGRACIAGSSFAAGTTFNAPALAAGDPVVATATSFVDGACGTIADGTSEFSTVATAAACTPPAVTITGPVTYCTGSPAITLDAGAGFASYAWSTGATTQTITVSPASTVTYTVTVTNAIGCSNSDTHTVAVSAPPAVTITGPTATCAGTPVTLDAGAGFASYLWSNGATSQMITVSPTSTTTYSVTVSNGTCSATDSHTVNVSANPTATLTTPVSICANGSGNAAVAAQAGATYAWTLSNGTITGGAGTSAITFTAGATGSVGINVVVTVGSCTSNGSASVPITTAPTVTITGPTATCANTTFTLDAGAGFASYLWTTGETTQTITRTQSAASQVYGVTVTAAGGCTASDTHTVAVSGNPIATISAPSSAPPNTGGLVASVPSQAGATFDWTITNGTITSATNGRSITFKTGASGVTKLHSTVTIGGCVDVDNHNVSITTSATEADLAITKTAAASVTAGGSLTYTIGVVNNGPASASGVVIDDVLPAGTSVTSINAGPWSCSQGTGSVRCTGSAAAGAVSSILITVTAPAQTGTMTNSVTISSAVVDPNSSNNSASATTSVTQAPVNCASVPPALLTPANGATVTSPVSLSWSSVSGASDYEVWLVTNGNPSLAGTTASTSMSVSAGSGTTSWYVVAKQAGGCEPLVSATRTFTIEPTSECATHGAPQITSPTGGTFGSPVNFSWSPVPQAIGYRLWVEVDGTAAQDLGTTDGAITLTVAVPPGAIVASVDALFNGCPPTRSAPVRFTVTEPDPCARRAYAAPTSPGNDSVVNSSAVTFQWNPANAADGYRVWTSIDGGTPSVVGTTDDATLQATLERGSVNWWVESLYDGCSSTESQHFTFTIPAASQCGTARAELVSPANGVTLNSAPVTFQWTAVPNALAYELWLSVGNGTPTLIGTTAQTSFSSVVPAGQLEWFVRALVDRCPSRDSIKARFTFNEPAACDRNRRAMTLSPLAGSQVTSPVSFAWTEAEGASSYDVFVQRGASAPVLVGSTQDTTLNGVTLANGKLRWFVRAHFQAGCPVLDSSSSRLEVVPAPQACAPLDPPLIAAPGQISSGVSFALEWTPISGATVYQLQVSDSSDFSGAQNVTTNATSSQVVRTNNGSTAAGVYARVRAIDGRCTPPTTSGYGPTAAIFVLPARGNEASIGSSDGPVTFTIPLAASFAGQTFTAVSKHAWLTVNPASGVVPAGGTNLVVTADPSSLPLGTSLGGVVVTLTSPSAGNVASQGTTSIKSPFSVSLVTPVLPTTKSTPPPDALIIPAVAHADGINSRFQSDVRVSNTSPQVMTYELTFTPSGDTGITEGKQTTFSVEPGQTIALDDILRTWFTTGTGGGTGSLEIRPITQSASKTSAEVASGLSKLVTFASSRTFNVASNGTFGQYIPAVPFANFIGKAASASSRSVLSLQQVAQSTRFRTNLGILEGSGEPVSLLVKVFGDGGQKLTEFPVSLTGGQHTQLNSFLSANGVPSLSDGRVELEVTSATGKITAYASVLDNETSDPLLVTPVTLSESGNTKWVMPGVADLNNGFANWQTDMRVFNADANDVEAEFTFYSQAGTPGLKQTFTIPAGQVRQFDRALATMFNLANDGGAIHMTTPATARLIATARTYNQTGTGTYGQFISAVTPEEAAGIDTRPLQLLQVEESARFRSNVGLAEVTGNPVLVEITVVPPDSKFSAITQVQLKPNEFRQIGSLLSAVGLSDTHNARITVRAVEGSGRVAAYVSVIDLETNDPTYVPAQ